MNRLRINNYLNVDYKTAFAKLYCSLCIMTLRTKNNSIIYTSYSDKEKCSQYNNLWTLKRKKSKELYDMRWHHWYSYSTKYFYLKTAFCRWVTIFFMFPSFLLIFRTPKKNLNHSFRCRYFAPNLFFALKSISTFLVKNTYI